MARHLEDVVLRAALLRVLIEGIAHPMRRSPVLVVIGAARHPRMVARHRLPKLESDRLVGGVLRELVRDRVAKDLRDVGVRVLASDGIDAIRQGG